MPVWKTPGIVRAELNEPRWIAAPKLGFDNDPTGNAGLYRVMVDPTESTLAISLQAPVQHGTPTNADVIYFGFTTDGSAGKSAKSVGIQVNGIGAIDPSDAAVIQQHNYQAGTWTSPLGAPSWLRAASVWRNNAAGDAAWGINFNVDLAAAGLIATTAFKIQLALHIHDDVTPTRSIDVSTPDPGANPLLPGTLLVSDPAKWASAAAISARCADGITLEPEQIGTGSEDGSNVLDTTPGNVNHFFVRPTVPPGVGLFPGLFRASFYLVPCGAAASAIWPSLGQAANGTSPERDLATVELVCPANTTSTTCGIAIPNSGPQCVIAALDPAPSQFVLIEKAVAYRALDLPPPQGEAGASGAGGAGEGGAGGAPAITGGGGNGNLNEAGQQSAGTGGSSGAPHDDHGDSGGAKGSAAFHRIPYHCSCHIPGGGSRNIRSAPWSLYGLGVLAITFSRRRRRRRRRQSSETC